MEYNLCGGKSACCPSLKVSDSGVEIGEKKNAVKLSKGEWNQLVNLIKSGKVGEL